MVSHYFFKISKSVLFSVVLLAGCSKQVIEKIAYGRDYCDHCKMQISDKRYGGAILTKNGRTFKFDSIECLNESKKTIEAEVKEIYFVDYETAELKPRDQLQLYRDDKKHGPMGTNIEAWSTTKNIPAISLKEVSR